MIDKEIGEKERQRREKISAAQKGNKNSLGYRHSQEARAKISAANKGRQFSEQTRAKLSSAQKGKRHSLATRAKIGAALTGRQPSQKTCEKISLAKRGRRRPPFSVEWRERMRLAKLGKTMPSETRLKIRAALAGKPKPPFSKEHRRNLSAALTGRKFSPQHVAKLSGKLHWNYRGGSRMCYPPEFNEALKRLVRSANGNACSSCGKQGKPYGRNLSVHHINGNKADCRLENLLPLCVSCHSQITMAVPARPVCVLA
jgi:hypothetical protein